MRICQQCTIVQGSLCYYISFHMEVTPFVLTKNMRMKLSSVCFSPSADNAVVTQHPLFSLRERFNLCFFISLGAGLLTCSVHHWFRERKPLMHNRLLRQVSSLTSPLENWFLMHPNTTPHPQNLQMWNHVMYEFFTQINPSLNIFVPFGLVAMVALVLLLIKVGQFLFFYPLLMVSISPIL